MYHALKNIIRALTLGVNPLKKAPTPSCLIMSLIMVAPPTLDPKLAFWIRVLTTSRGAATVMEATAPAIEATKSKQRGFSFSFFLAHGTAECILGT